MKTDEIIALLSNLNEAQAEAIAKAVFVNENRFGEQVQRFINSIVMHFLVQFRANDNGTITNLSRAVENMIVTKISKNAEFEILIRRVIDEKFDLSKVMQSAVSEATELFMKMPESPLKEVLTEQEVCKLIGMGSQYLKTLRSNGGDCPDYEKKGKDICIRG